MNDKLRDRSEKEPTRTGSLCADPQFLEHCGGLTSSYLELVLINWTTKYRKLSLRYLQRCALGPVWKVGLARSGVCGGRVPQSHLRCACLAYPVIQVCRWVGLLQTRATKESPTKYQSRNAAANPSADVQPLFPQVP